MTFKCWGSERKTVTLRAWIHQIAELEPPLLKAKILQLDFFFFFLLSFFTEDKTNINNSCFSKICNAGVRQNMKTINKFRTNLDKQVSPVIKKPPPNDQFTYNNIVPRNAYSDRASPPSNKIKLMSKWKQLVIQTDHLFKFRQAVYDRLFWTTHETAFRWRTKHPRITWWMEKQTLKLCRRRTSYLFIYKTGSS